MAKSLVFGANGFIGSHLVDSLVERGHEVRAFDRFSREINRFNSSDRIEEYAGDFLNRHDIAEALEGVNVVYHFISTTTPITAEDDPLIDVETNIRMSIQLFEECIKKGVNKVVFASTGGAIYGNINQIPFSESTLPQPVSPYAIAKLTIEHYLRYFKVKYGLDSVAYRISNPYGPRQPLHRKQGVIPIFMEKLAGDQELTVLGDGEMVRDYIFVKDAADMIAEASTQKNNKEVYNIGAGQGVSINQLLELIEKVTDKKARTVRQPAPKTFTQTAILDTKLFTDEFGLAPNTGLEEGLARTWKYVSEEYASSL
jgi:UDP-glucose 4-epimerase